MSAVLKQNITAIDCRSLGGCPKGWRGQIAAIKPVDLPNMPSHEIERRLLEMGFVEGAQVELLHDGPIGRDPIAVRIDDATVALRRRDAAAVFVTAA